MGLSVRASRILERLHNTIQTPGFQSGVHDLGARLHELRVDGKATVRKREFVNAMAGDGLLSAEEAEVLFKGLAASASIGGDGESASLHEVLRALRLPVSRQRAALTRAVFDMIDQDRDGLLSSDEITACYRAANHPDVRCGLRAAAKVRQDFVQTLSEVSGNGRGGMVSFPAFLDFYCCLTAFTSEDHFRNTIVAVWVPPVSVDNDQGYALHILGGAGGLVANLRSQILARGLLGVSTFRRSVRGAAIGGAGEITQEAFRAASGLAGAELTANEMTQAFRHLDRRGAGMIHVEDALRAVRGEVNKRRECDIDEAFDSLLLDADGDNGKDCDTLDPAAVATRFRAEAHPDAASGVRPQRDILSEFLEAFDGGGEVGGRVTRTEWHEHHADMSALISDDEAFWSYLWNVWGLSGGRGSDNGERDNGKQIPTRNSSANRVIGKSRPPLSAASNLRRSDEDDGMGDHTLSSGISDTEARKSVAEKADRHPRDLSLHSIPYKAWAALPSSNAETVDFVGRATSRGVPGNSIPAGVAGLLERARGSLAVGGVRDAFRLLKGFREEDHGGDGKVSLTGFKAAIGGARFGLNETEIRIIFQHFDQDGDGEVTYESFLRSIRETLPTRRLVLTHQAFDRMDSNGNGVVFVSDIAQSFKASAHPEVLEGSREEQDVRREFLDSFAVSDGGRSLCTRDDFIGWMELISSSLPIPAADHRFESLVRGCWGLPKGADRNVNGQWIGATGEGNDGNRGPVMVAVTHADGSVSIEAVSTELKAACATDDKRGSNTAVISEAQADRIRQELLETRGIHAVHVRLLDKQPDYAGRFNRGDESIHAADGNDGNKPCSGGSVSLQQPSTEEVRIARLGASGDGHDARGSSGGYGTYGGGDVNLGLDHGLLSVLEVARGHLVSRGPAGFFSLSERLHSKGYIRSPRSDTVADAHDHTKNGPFLSLGGFKEALLEVGCGLTSKDLTSIFTHLDKEGRGEIPVDVALDALRGGLGGARLSLVRTAFSRLRGGGNTPAETAVAADVVLQFDPKGHPEVIAGRRTPEDVRKNFMDYMTTTNGLVTKKDFETYYTSVSAATPSNAYFSLQVKACWGLGTAATASATTTSYGAAPGHALAHQTIQRISADYDPTLKRRTFSKARTSAPPGVLPGTTESGNTAAVADAKREGSRKVGGGGRVPTPGVRAVLRRLGAEARAQGAAWGLAGLRRALHDADRDKDGFLSLREFKAALMHSGAGLTAAEIRTLFTHLETWGGARRAGGGGGDGNGVVPWKTLLDAVRPPLCGQRLELVRLAFTEMDRRGEGVVSPETVSQRFDASRHPSVLRGHATAEEVRKELLDTFFAAATPGGRVSEEDFVGHHANLSFGVPSDAQFHQLISNCWGLDDQNAADQNRVPQTDGTMPIDADIAGLAGNSNLRKFLVSYADGSQSVEELTFPSEGREEGERETPLSSAEESAVKRVLLKRDNIHATQVRLLPQANPEKTMLPQESPSVDRRPAWAWAPMSLAEINAATAAAANPDTIAQQEKVNAEGGMDLSPKRPKNDERGADGSLEGVGGVEWEEAGWQGGGGGDEGGAEAGEGARQRMRAGGTRNQTGEGREADLSVRYLMAKVRAELNTGRVAGVEDLTRRLRESVVKHGGNICYIGVREVDFRNAVREAGVPLTESDTRRIFAHFEMGSSGVMNPDALLSCLAGRMSNVRRMLVDDAFDRLDTSGTGCLAFGQVVDAFDPTRHPEVVSGCQSLEGMLSEFVARFAAGLPEDPRDETKVTKDDFRRYYDAISCEIPDDASFEVLLKVSWRTPVPEASHSASASACDTGGRKPHASVTEVFSNGQAGRRHFSPENSAANGLTMGNDHGGSVPVNVAASEGRESSFDALRESRAAGSGLGGRNTPAPSKENRRLRSALLSRTFDSQIYFGGAVNEPPDEDRASSVGEVSSRLPAGGGRGGRMAEGAAWIPGGRRIIPNSVALMSHLSNGLRVTRDEAEEKRIEQGRRPRDNSAIDNHNNTAVGLSLEGYRLNSALARKSQAAADARRDPVWVPQHPTTSNHTPATILGNHDVRGGQGSSSPFDSVSLAQVAGTVLKRDARGGQEDSRRVPGDAVASLRRDDSVPPAAEATMYRKKLHTTGQSTGRREREDEISSVCSSHGTAGRAVKGRGRDFDWWGGGGVPITGRVRMGGVGGGSSRSKNVSDTYKSSLVFG